ncbi:MAG: phosphate/phosphite/phosphonate ABC transporter substrate-binding protein [Candidatus Thiodiazotropha lotti]|uniref:Phosphate/phosphite/phosphonate ABC transporter substrate-binding protein n=1 Tax=Candidatus Thiodiazotropha lotti TaxID=2792787 RepID=A0A9E4K4Y4_9GAMM|nr:phosphate/phosphite/phosphonate ABC transporter substrate-binding protein [Candidatus Thiodiazotropha lotti]MCG7923314.1 phosphate/phosphite/phosphonate ABC transporter substrate-binding protein [Candidatus Thiodiazotropha lotti]MCG7931179.1 phosphate/phosphite/phosphonate ABC transporter substrate-binding protein [Candidatus Thiodiazotropha lotti]MCG7938816.1 phosphate/phosphite/phosphonate ABC transporter substrate-binding protein [Candidatus Thiodiazotropha lotti]MCG7988513.1 phosphate/ph
MKRLLAIASIAVLSSILAITNSAYADDYKIGVLAKRGVAKAMKKWGDTAEYMTEKIAGDKFTIVPLDFDEVFPAIENKEVDFFLVNSSMFVTAQVKYGAKAVATMVNSRQGEALKSFGGVILTYIDRDDINSAADIKGKNFMAVKESSFGGWQMAYKELLDQGVDPTKDFASLQFGGKHDNVVFAVQNGEVDAGTVRTDTLERMASAGDIDLSEFKIISSKTHSGFPFVVSTALYPEWPFAKISDTPDDVASRAANALIALKSDAKAAQSAKIVGWTAPLDYTEVEDLQKLLKVGAYQ